MSLIKLTTIAGNVIWINMGVVQYIAEVGEGPGCIVAFVNSTEKVTVQETMRDIFDRLSGRGGVDVPRLVKPA